MPSGLTCDIENGQSFDEFLWRCARYMGAFIHMREDPYDARIRMPENEDGEWHRKALIKSVEELKLLTAMTSEETEEKAAEAHREALKFHEKCDDSSSHQREAYEAMLGKVRTWEPPTPTHKGLKRVMEEQITESIRFDCGGDSDPPKPLTGQEWRKQRLEVAERGVAYHTKELAADIERAKERREWIEALIKSVPIPEKLRPL